MEDKRRIWIVSELYYPELTSTGYFLTGIAEGLASKYDISVICGQPSYLARGIRAPSREQYHGVDIYRCQATTFDKNKLSLRAINLITISISMFWMALLRFRRGDIVLTVTNPPSLPYSMSLACRLKRARFLLRVEDVYPDVFVKVGMLRHTSLSMRLLDRLSRWLYHSAERIVVLGRDMRSIVASKLKGHPNRIELITNWGDTEGISPRPLSGNKLLRKLDLLDSFVIQYCGNIGRTHGMTDLVDAIELLESDGGFHFLIIGWGAKRRWVIEQKEKRQLKCLKVLDPLPAEELNDGLNACNISIITFSAGMSGVSVPSRMYNVLASGKPLLAVCDDNSELAAVVREEGIGWVVSPGRPDLIVAALQEAKSNPELLRSMGEHARNAAETKYTKARVIQGYESLMEGLDRIDVPS